MLHTHGRYDYSNITERPDYSWPGGKRLAVYVAVNIEQFRYGEGKGAAIAPPDQANSHSVFSWRDYGNRVGIWRLFDLFDTLAIPIEAQMNTAIYEHSPDIPARLRARGDEILRIAANVGGLNQQTLWQLTFIGKVPAIVNRRHELRIERRLDAGRFIGWLKVGKCHLARNGNAELGRARKGSDRLSETGKQRTWPARKIESISGGCLG